MVPQIIDLLYFITWKMQFKICSKFYLEGHFQVHELSTVTQDVERTMNLYEVRVVVRGVLKWENDKSEFLKDNFKFSPSSTTIFLS